MFLFNWWGNDDYTNYNWSFEPASNPGAYVSVNPEKENVCLIQDAQLSNSGVYYVEAKDINGCEVSDNVRISFYTAAPPELKVTEDLCRGETIDILASNGYDSYRWYNGSSTFISF